MFGYFFLACSFILLDRIVGSKILMIKKAKILERDSFMKLNLEMLLLLFFYLLPETA